MFEQVEENVRFWLKNERLRGIMTGQMSAIDRLRDRVRELSAMLPEGSREDPIVM